MGLKFQHVFAGVGMRGGEVDRQAAVDGRARRILERCVCRASRVEGLAAQGFGEHTECRARDPHDADRATPARGGNGDDGVGAAWQALLAEHAEPSVDHVLLGN